MKYVYIYNYSIVKDLLKNNFVIKDIKSNPANKNRTIFMFKETDEIKDYLRHTHNVVFSR